MFNNTTTHESQLNAKLIEKYVQGKQILARPRIDPAEIKLPPYRPDLPELSAGHGFGFELRMTDTTANKSKPMLDNVTLRFQ